MKHEYMIYTEKLYISATSWINLDSCLKVSIPEIHLEFWTLRYVKKILQDFDIKDRLAYMSEHL